VDGDRTLPTGELVVEEASGRILRQESHRSLLPGTVRSEDLDIEYEEVLPDVNLPVRSTSYERWISSRADMTQVQRRLTYRNLKVNQEGFDLRREQARQADTFMLRETPDGVRYFVKQADGTRVTDPNPRTRSRASAIGALFVPGLAGGFYPMGGYVLADNNLDNRGISYSAAILVVANMVQATLPHVLDGFDLSVSHLSILLPEPLLPVSHGQVEKEDAVGQMFGNLKTTLSHDLGMGFRLGLEERLQYDVYRTSCHLDGQELVDYATPGYLAPPDGMTSETRAHLGWQKHGFQLQTFYGRGERPTGTYGTAEAPQAVPDLGRFSRWGGSAGYDLSLGRGAYFHTEAAALSGDGFDRFKALDLSDAGASLVAGFSPYVLTSDRAAYGKVAFVLPPRPSLRLTLGLDFARIRALDDHKDYTFTGLAVGGDLPGFWKFTSTRVDLGFGLQSTMAGARSLTGSILFIRVF
jgi:hypothetical protein